MRNTAGSNSAGCSGELTGKKILLGVTGGIAAYKAAYLASALVKRGADVHVVMTDHALKLIAPATFWGITSNDVVTDLFEPPKKREIVHVSLSESADLMLIAPATANVIGKLANGIADDMLTTMALVAQRIAICPAMNVHMYKNPIVMENIARLRNRGISFIEPEVGRLACGDEGIGRLADPDRIVEAVQEILTGGRKDYVGKHVLVTAGPTREPIDPVRYISNRSSGKMGYAIAAEATARGASVTLVSGPTELDAPSGVEVVSVETVQEMHEAVVSRAGDADVFISAAAPADFRPAQRRDQKIKKTDHLTLELDKTEDILSQIAASKGHTIVVGFAAETENLIENAVEKLRKKNCDMIVANNVGAESDVFGSDTNEVTLISRTGESMALPKMAKREVARAILDYVESKLMEG